MTSKRYLRCFGGRLAACFAGSLLGLMSSQNLGATALASSYNTPGTSGIGTSKGSVIAQQFILTLSSVVNSVDLALEGPGGVTLPTDLVLQVYTNSGNAPATLDPGATDTGVTGTLASSTFSDVNFTFNPVTLAAGTYWLVFSNAFASTVTWEQQSSVVTNSDADGSIPNVINTGSTITGTDSLMATINGAASTPEPSTVFTGFSALLALLAIRRKFAVS